MFEEDDTGGMCLECENPMCFGQCKEFKEHDDFIQELEAASNRKDNEELCAPCKNCMSPECFFPGDLCEKEEPNGKH